MASYRIDVRPFLEITGGSVDVADEVDLGNIVVGDEVFAARGPATFEVTISNAGEALVAFGRVSAPVRATCSRCLIDFDTDISGDIEGYWLRPGEEAPEGQEVTGTVDSDGAVDVADALIAALVIEAPFAPLHAEDCKGLCPTCGCDLNTETCECASKPRADNPFAALGELIVQDDDSK